MSMALPLQSLAGLHRLCRNSGATNDATVGQAGLAVGKKIEKGGM
jgi:hypothetical protein